MRLYDQTRLAVTIRATRFSSFELVHRVLCNCDGDLGLLLFFFDLIGQTHLFLLWNYLDDVLLTVRGASCISDSDVEGENAQVTLILRVYFDSPGILVNVCETLQLEKMNCIQSDSMSKLDVLFDFEGISLAYLYDDRILFRHAEQFSLTDLFFEVLLRYAYLFLQ